jgi:hypothetical protein
LHLRSVLSSAAQRYGLSRPFRGFQGFVALWGIEPKTGSRARLQHIARRGCAGRRQIRRHGAIQITAELKQQSYTRPDAAKVAAATATAGAAESINQKEYANLLKMKAKDQAATAAATATDTATAVASGGLVQGRAQQAADKAMRADHDANNERIMKEDMPTYSKLTGQTADFGADFASQLKENPRLARLMQLARAKHCKGGG